MKKLFLSILVICSLLGGSAYAGILPDVSPTKQYKFATEFLKTGDYEKAEQAFKEFIKLNPNHKLAANAQYWYAETFRIKGLYVEASQAYLVGYEKYPRSEKAPINLLKLGTMLVEIDEKKQGCKMIKGVSSQYPNANSSVLEKANEEYAFYKCNINDPTKNKIELAKIIDKAKDTCKSLGFKEGTEKFADCSLKLYSQSVELAAEQNKTVVMQPQSSGSNVMTIYDPVRDNNALIKRGQRMLSGACTLGIDC